MKAAMFKLQERAQEEADDEDGREQHADGGEGDRAAERPGPVGEDAQLRQDALVRGTRGAAQILGKDARAVDDAPEAVGHAEQDQPDAGDQDHGADGKLQGGNQIGEGHGIAGGAWHLYTIIRRMKNPPANAGGQHATH